MASNEELQRRIDQLKISPTTGGVIQPGTQRIIDQLQGQMTDTGAGSSGEKSVNDAGGTSGQDSLLDIIQKRLLSETDVVTSEDTGAEKLFGEAIAGLEESLDISEKGIKARFEQLRGEEAEFGESQALNALENRRGFATQGAILRNIKDDTEKDIRQLDLLEQEALAAGRTDIATKLAEIKLQKISFAQEASQRVFSNLLGLGNLAVSVETSDRLKQQATFDQMQTKLNFLSENQLLGNLSGEDKRLMEAQFDLPNGTLDKLALNQPLNLRTVDGVGLVNISRDKNGRIISTVITPEIPKDTDSNKTATRLSAVSVNLLEAAGEDTLVTASSYNIAERLWSNLGGTRLEFLNEFPPELHLNDEELSKLPSAFTAGDETDVEAILKLLGEEG